MAPWSFNWWNWEQLYVIYWQLAFNLNCLISQVCNHVLYWIQNNTRLSLSFCCVIALEYSLSFSNLAGEPSLHSVSIQRKEMKFPLMIFGWAVMSVACMKKNGIMVLMKKFQLKKMMFWWSFCILLIHQYIFIGLQLTLNAGSQ